MKNRSILGGCIAMMLLVAATGCSLIFPPDKPVVVISSPPSGSQFHESEEIAVQSSSTDPKGVVRVELLVDGVVVDVDASPTATGQSSFTLLQTWKATNPGAHTIFVKAYNRAGIASDPSAISVTILQGVAQSSNPAPTTVSAAPTATTAPNAPAPSPTPTSAAAPCVNNAAFVADITVPDGTQLAPTQAFTKIWRVSNPAGGCAWGPGYQFVFVSGSAMTSSTVVPVPNTPPGATADLAVPMTAPTQPANYVGSWRLRAPNAALFGGTMSVKITVPGAPPPPPPPACTGTPNVFTFSASATTITAGSSSTLQWGEVTNADSFEIDQGIGGQPTPGSTSVSPGSTKTYTATAHCGANTRTAQVTITVNPAGPAAIIRNSMGGTESGTVYASGSSPVHGTMLAGDTSGNVIMRAFMSFDISDISNKTIVSASLDLTGCTVLHDPFSAHPAGLDGIWVGDVQYTLPLDQSDYGITGTGIVLLSAKPTSTIDVKANVQNRVNQSKSRFQIRLHPNYANSNGDNQSDYISCGSGGPKLNVIYQP